MSIGLVGKKCGMSRLFTEDGRSLPVTLIEATPNRVTQVKGADGYVAVQVTAGAKRASLLTKPAKGHFAKAKVEPGRGLWEFRLDDKDAGKYAIGAEIKVDDVFKVGQDRKSTRLNSSHPSISYAVFCLKKKKQKK